jgi:excisionase family DNA binding protein
MKMTEHDASENIELQSPLLPPWLQTIIHEEGRLTLTDYEAARLLGVSRGSVRAAIAEHEIHVVRLGRRMLIPIIPLLTMMGLDPSLEGSDR